MKVKTILLFLFAVTLIGATPVLIRGFSHEKKTTEEKTSHKIVKIAVCPTFYNTVTLLGEEIYPVNTGSTAESISLLTAGKVDYVLAGRILKPGEKMFPFAILGSGYSFLASEEKTIMYEELRKQSVYTDIDIEELGQVFGLDNISRVSDVYNYLGKGIIITSWDNTDYLRAETVHLVDENGNRIPESRLPILYCSSECDDEIVNKLKTHLTII